MLDVVVSEMTEHYELIRTVQRLGPGALESITSDIWGLPEHLRPVPVVVFADEVAELFLTANGADDERRDQMVTQLVRLTRLGRAAGMYPEVCGQRFGSDLGKGATALRAQLTGRIPHRVDDEATAKTVLGDISPQAMLAGALSFSHLHDLAEAAG